MAKFSLVSCFLITFCVGCVYCEIQYVATGSKYTFTPKISGVIEAADWRYNGDLVVEWGVGSQPFWYRGLDKHLSLNPENGGLTLTAQKSNVGKYKVQFQVKGQDLQYYERDLVVIDPLPQPTVTCSLDGKNLTLLCSLNPPMQADFSWNGPESQRFNKGNSLQVIKESNKVSIYFCNVKNQVSENTTEFNLDNCPKEDSPSVNVRGIVGGIFGFLLVVAGAVAGGVLYKNKKGPFNRVPNGGQDAEKTGGENNSRSPDVALEHETNKDNGSL